MDDLYKKSVPFLERKFMFALVNRKPVAINLYESMELKNKDRRLKKPRNHIRKSYINDVLISTVMLNTDHGYNDTKPLLFETMIFNPKKESNTFARAYTHREALKNHREMIALVKTAM